MIEKMYEDWLKATFAERVDMMTGYERERALKYGRTVCEIKGEKNVSHGLLCVKRENGVTSISISVDRELPETLNHYYQAERTSQLIDAKNYAKIDENRKKICALSARYNKNINEVIPSSIAGIDTNAYATKELLKQQNIFKADESYMIALNSNIEALDRTDKQYIEIEFNNELASMSNNFNKEAVVAMKQNWNDVNEQIETDRKTTCDEAKKYVGTAMEHTKCMYTEEPQIEEEPELTR